MAKEDSAEKKNDKGTTPSSLLQFKQYMPLSDEEKTEIWTKGVIVLDTNIWLTLYRMPEQSRNNFIKILKDSAITKRLWIPHQVAKEFFKNRLEVIYEQKKKAEKFISDISKSFDDIGQYHPIIDKDKWKKVINELKEEAKIKTEDYPFSARKDELLPEICGLFEKNIGKPLTKIQEINKEADQRFNDKIPPGFCDKKKKGPDKGYGDLYIWKQILEEMTTKKIGLVFVTDDKKEDWWEKIQGGKIGPHPLLREEYIRATGRDFAMCTSERFLDWAKEHITVEIADEQYSQLSAAFLESHFDEGSSFINKMIALDGQELWDEIESLVSENVHELLDEDEVNGLIASTNTFGWEVDSFKIESYEMYCDTISVVITFSCFGEINPDQVFSGNRIFGKATMLFDENGYRTFEDISAKKQDLFE